MLLKYKATQLRVAFFCNYSNLFSYNHMKAKERREELLKKIKEKKRLRKHREKRYKQAQVEASLMLEVYKTLGYVTILN